MVGTLMQPQEADLTYSAHRMLKKSDHQITPLRWKHVLHLHLSGRTVQEIKELTSYSVPMIYRILGDNRILSLRQQILEVTQKEFEALFADVVDVIRTSLASDDERIRLEGTNQWLKAHGKFREGGGSLTVNITAEDVVQNILNGSVDGK